MGWVDRLLGLFSYDLGIDLGTANTLVAVQGKGIVISEPSVVAVKKGTNQVLMDGQAVGNMAKTMMGKTPGSIEAIRPMKDGVIADFEITEAMLRYFIQKGHGRRGPIKPRVVIAVPLGITAVERRAVKNSATNAGARRVYTIPEPMAAAVGAGLPVAEPVGSMIVDIGGGTSEVAVISLAGVVSAESLRVGGDELDRNIQSYLKREYQVLVGENTAEKIKFEIGAAVPLEQELRMTIRGRDLQSGMPRQIEISSTEIAEALREPVGAIVNTIKVVLERTEPELAADLLERGICLAGGTSLLRGLPEVIQRATGLPVRIADDPLTCVARGCAALLEDLDAVKQILDIENE
ncbi:MAG: rod shape-determining protein [Planctomycetota bacterium]